MNILVIYNLKRKNFFKGIPRDFYSEFDSYKTVKAIADALRERGHRVRLKEANGQLLSYLIDQKREIDFVFNIAEGINGYPSRESQVPAILDFLEIPYTGSNVLTLAISLDKFYTKKLCIVENIPTPKFQFFPTEKEKIDSSLRFPLIVKPNAEGSAKGITKDSVVYNKQKLREQINRVIRDYKQPALVEEFIEGKEITVGILGNDSPVVFPLLEIDFSSCRGSGEFFYSWRMKEFQGDRTKHLTPTFYCPARIEEKVAKKISELALKAYRAIGCFDFSRIDFRLDRENNPYFLEINPLPGLDPIESNFPLMARTAGISYKELVNKILEVALKRVNGRFKKGGRLVE
ncbi:MAG: ATP-grasp domain-containing protein [Candidatus Omnitrophica bacterium]|nr:ATP-grasp domain-containing protein [Candidatus Omnitrophota bacterium]MCM8793483.1 ATP-grasp domain-containing protein [Candidatus Omnitrophota bacterium]